MPIEPSVPGDRRCMNCQKTFRSPDVMRIRRCQKCKKAEEGCPIRVLSVDQGDGAVRHHTRQADW